MNPCPCGFLSDPVKDCVCGGFQLQRYQGRISGPLLDRIDLHVEVPRIPFEKISDMKAGEDSSIIRKRVQIARKSQQERFQSEGITSNAEMTSPLVKKHCPIGDDAQELLRSAMSQMNLSGRAFYRILKLARTIADLAESENIELPHVAEAIGYREQQG